MVVNLLIGTAEDQDRLENISTKGLSELTELKLNRKASRKGGLVDYCHGSDHPFVSLNKFRIQGNKDYCTLQKIIPQNSMNFRNLSSCGTIINPHEIQQRLLVARNE